MAASPVPAPQEGQGPGPGGGFPAAAPPVQDQGSGELLKLALGMVSNARMIAQRVPATTSEVRQINDLVAQMMSKIKQGQATPEPQAPPV